jgi:hypothetical protein
MFVHQVASAGHVVHSGKSRERNVDTLFFMLGWDWYRFDKKCAMTHYAELVFLNPVGYVGHVVHSGASRECNNDALFFMLEWARSVSIKYASGHVMLNMCFYSWWDL